MRYLNGPKILAVVFLFNFLCYNVNKVEAKRLPPKEVKPVIHNGIKYSATHEKMGYVEAWDIENNEKLWKKKVYAVDIDPRLEADVQWIFITSLIVDDGKLIVVNEAGNRYEIDIENVDVSQPDADTVSKNNSKILLAISILLIGGYLLYRFSKKRG